MSRHAYRVREVADYLGVSEFTVRRWIATGELEATKLGGTWLVPAEALQARLGVYDAERAQSQRGEPVPALEGRPVGGDGHDAGRPPSFPVRTVERRGPDKPARTAPATRPADAAGSAGSPSWSLPPEVA